LPTFNPKQLGYGLFTRSHETPRFESFSRQDSFVCWIDILGVQGMNHQQIVSTIKRALLAASESSATGAIRTVGASNYPILIGTPQAAVQYSIVGDALVLAEKEQPDTQGAATLGLIYRANLLSRFLFEEGFIHRGVITRGPVHCEKVDDANVITGKGVVDAFNLEKSLKVAGLFFDQNTLDFINSGRQRQIDQHSFCAPFSQLPNWNTHVSPGLAGVSFSQYDGWTHWTTAVANGNAAFSSIQNATNLIGVLRTVYGLP
jgi:hypothetical protein